MNRRQFLLTVLGAGAAPAGCLSGPTGETPSPTATPSPGPDGCEGFQPHPVDLSTYSFSPYGDGFELTASTGQLPLGDELSITLENTTDEERATGNETLFAVQRAVDDGWEHVLWAPENWVWTEEARIHEPGARLEWTFPFTTTGLSIDPYRVCTDLPAGVYRFVYWGLTGSRRALAVTFTAGLPAEPLVIEDYETHVVDHADIGGPIIDGGVAFDVDPMASRHVVEIIGSAGAAGRFDLETLESIDAAATQFVEETDFETAYLLVFQAFPASSKPDYRVTRIERLTDDIHLRVTDVSEGGTADVTVETLLVRLPLDGNSPPRHATVTTEDGVTYSTT